MDGWILATGRWRPIETAPTDKPVLAYWADKYGGAYGVAILEVLGEGFEPGWIDPNDHQDFVPPTYWMPLPEAPNASDKGRA